MGCAATRQDVGGATREETGGSPQGPTTDVGGTPTGRHNGQSSAAASAGSNPSAVWTSSTAWPAPEQASSSERGATKGEATAAKVAISSHANTQRCRFRGACQRVCMAAIIDSLDWNLFDPGQVRAAPTPPQPSRLRLHSIHRESANLRIGICIQMRSGCAAWGWFSTPGAPDHHQLLHTKGCTR